MLHAQQPAPARRMNELTTICSQSGILHSSAFATRASLPHHPTHYHVHSRHNTTDGPCPLPQAYHHQTRLGRQDQDGATLASRGGWQVRPLFVQRRAVRYRATILRLLVDRGGGGSSSSGGLVLAVVAGRAAGDVNGRGGGLLIDGRCWRLLPVGRGGRLVLACTGAGGCVACES